MYMQSPLLAVVYNSSEEFFTRKYLYMYNVAKPEPIGCLKFEEDILGLSMNNKLFEFLIISFCCKRNIVVIIIVVIITII